MSTPENYFGKQIFLRLEETIESVKLIKIAILGHLLSVNNSLVKENEKLNWSTPTLDGAKHVDKN